MLRSLGITSLIKWFVIACVGVAIWQSYNGNIGSIADAVWGWVQAGAEVVTKIWNSINANAGGDIGGAGNGNAHGAGHGGGSRHGRNG